ncbi:16S rRNA (guanine(966)-N(2))-methyltransferase RsmD [Gordonia sp. NPDC003376]
MTRIIAGRFRGHRIAVPDEGTRPTSDRVREAVFNVLGTRIDLDEARVLDLYAGSGALGIEALSRGATYAEFVDSRRRATAVITKNLSSLKVSRETRVVTGTAASYLAGGTGRPFDVVFSDPPYALGDEEMAADLTALAGGWLTEDGLVVLERDRRSAVDWPESFEVIVDKTYGDTVVQVARLA